MLSDHPVLDPQAVCEVCGQPLRQVMMHTCEKRFGELCGPFLDEREHQIGMGRHYWLQPHNCLDPEPDRCTICEHSKAGRWMTQRPACCS